MATQTKTSQYNFAQAAAKAATPPPVKSSRPRRPKKTVQAKKTTMDSADAQYEFLRQLKETAQKLKDPQELEALTSKIKELPIEYPIDIEGARFGTRAGSFVNSTDVLQHDRVSDILDDVSLTAIGSLGGISGDHMYDNTIGLAKGMASGAVDTKGELAETILGDNSEVLAREI